LEDLQGHLVSLEQLRNAGKPFLLLFTHPGCGPCSALLPEVAAWQNDSATDFGLVVISQGTKEENLSKTKEYGLHRVLVQREHEISDRYDALSTPSAVLVRAGGTIGSAVATGAEAIRTLVSNTMNESVAALLSPQMEAGTEAPPLVFPDLAGRMFKLSKLLGKAAILLFWNPTCGFCQQMTDDLKFWEKKALKAGVQVVVISSGFGTREK
jgi:thiol-disulfide isomerase/thioredoxin